jgi:hypothetical protein
VTTTAKTVMAQVETVGHIDSVRELFSKYQQSLGAGQDFRTLMQSWLGCGARHPMFVQVVPRCHNPLSGVHFSRLAL